MLEQLKFIVTLEMLGCKQCKQFFIHDLLEDPAHLVPELYTAYSAS